MGCQTGNLPQAAILFDSSYGNTKKLLNPEIEELFRVSVRESNYISTKIAF